MNPRWQSAGRLSRILALAFGAMGLAIPVAPVAHAATCDGQQVVCAIGDTGPGGGVVFYDAGTRQAWGRYLEVAPATWAGSSGDPQVQWCSRKQPGHGTEVDTGTRVGSGKRNSMLIVKQCGTASAAGKAMAYRGGGQSNWYLPSKGELLLLWKQRAGSPGLPSDAMWTSSQWESDPAMGASVDFTPTQAWILFPPTGNANVSSKSISHYVRPVRAF